MNTGDHPPLPGWDCHVHVFEAGRQVLAGGHYASEHRPLSAIEALAAQHGVGHLVLVQPSVYGSDNELLLKALGQHPGQHRGVVVLAPNVTPAALQAMHAVGVRGARANLVSPVGNRAEELLALAPRLKPLGWHAQCFAHARQLPQVLAWARQSGLTWVLDHLGGLSPQFRRDDPAWAAMRALSEEGAWVKASAFYRLLPSASGGSAAAPHAGIDDALAQVAEWFGSRMVWGSDWPHTGLLPGDVPVYSGLLAPLFRVLGPQRAQEVLSAGALLYR
jgi:predicted TIM-barrel fold metal-dependent hydrolase